ncbi:hypothetical protein DENIS_1081 [Desulfonema ishimotonii]|uniref:CHAT domain-containing protein n=2 Tax=Desulfonema ishimotonii TaxID=45657 RepID=A0A401FT52_9BACT|nr:type III-E CRISPR-associated TPR-CHAT protein Csx29 [Desulfonema ishimotonii]7Y9X_B Chain B, CHAT domain-containing protein [Desulfonema ishimotonii]7Y9Y_B Chain B, CHAT domain-containing protein [Desulfonema ishimotonii]7YND_C Chain C, CHAT domain-containing protein [Desulfonema ishimotonii]8EEX_B Chain B, Csx29 [Desulfonema ishimotonii]8EEY_B Chain B, Csx29 [Desulfonema ishimotonii]8GS2_B Chain B, CHAT domain-containing protein [Desulfonema ishimotonii]GBC60136.1 hypothetical protein DE
MSNPIRDIQDRLKTAKFDNKDDMMNLASSLYKYEKQLMDSSEATLCQQGLSNRPNSFSQLSQFRDSDIQSKAGGQTGKFWQNEYEACKNFQTHKERRETLEQIIRFLQNGAEEKDADDLLLKTLARAYFHRGLLYRPKGFSVPARKVEAMKKAIAYCEIILDKNEEESEALRIWLYAAMELRRCGEEYPENFAEKLFYLANDGFISELYDIRLFLEYTEREEDNNFLDMILQENQDRERLFELCLYKARACFHLNQLNDVRIYGESAIDNAPGAFADPFWDELVEFIRMLRNKKSELWKEIAIKAWDKCREKEMKVGNNIYLSWYWARQRELYDLAFMAQDGIEKKTRIADSLKSRTTLRIQELNELRKDAHRKQNRRLEDKLDRIIEQENEARDGAYLRRNPPCFTGGKREEIPFARLPQNWIAVHFYLNELESHEGGKGGHALIYDPQKAEKDQWQDKSFDYKELHRKFLEWQENYILNEEGSADFLVTLCREIEKAMPFLFKSEVIPEDRPVLWIPHGFLHRLPLHAAMKSGNNSNIEIFWERHASRYLPAWHLFDPAPYSREESSTLLKNFEEYDFQNLENGEIEVYAPSSPKKVKEAIRENPAILLLLCHGEADMTNPFRSCLKLKNKDMTIFDLLTVEDVRLSGSRILLGACESDMVPPLEFSVDEHLSVSGAFLSHKAGEIVAGLWTVDSEKVDECYSYLVEEKDFLRNLQEWQMAETENFRSENDSSLFYKIAPFRIIGFPAE